MNELQRLVICAVNVSRHPDHGVARNELAEAVDAYIAASTSTRESALSPDIYALMSTELNGRIFRAKERCKQEKHGGPAAHDDGMMCGETFHVDDIRSMIYNVARRRSPAVAEPCQHPNHPKFPDDCLFPKQRNADYGVPRCAGVNGAGQPLYGDHIGCEHEYRDSGAPCLHTENVNFAGECQACGAVLTIKDVRKAQHHKSDRGVTGCDLCHGAGVIEQDAIDFADRTRKRETAPCPECALLD